MKNYLKIFGLILLILVINCGLAFSATYYVKNGGNDGIAGNSWANAWQTIAHALSGAGTASVVGAGDTILVADGTYPESITVMVSGSAGSPITVSGTNPTQAGAILDGMAQSLGDAFTLNNKNYLTFRRLRIQDYNCGGVHMIGSTYIRIESCEITGHGFAGIELYTGSHYCTVTDCDIFQNTTAFGMAAIYIEDGNWADINNSRIYNNFSAGVGILPSANPVVGTSITGNDIYGHLGAAPGIGLADFMAPGIPITGTVIEDNDLYSNSGGEILFLGDGIDSNFIRNNRIRNSGGSGISIIDGDNNVIADNTQIEANWYGVSLDGTATNNKVTNNNISSNDSSAVHLWPGADNNIIDNNDMVGNNSAMIAPGSVYIESSGNSIINNNAGIFGGTGSGIFFSSLNGSIGNNYVANNIIRNNTGAGITLVAGSGNSITNSTITNNQIISNFGGILLSGSLVSGNFILDNIVRNSTNSPGITILTGCNNYIFGNEIYENLFGGLALGSSANSNTVISNECYKNGQFGIGFTSVTNNWIIYNECYSNDGAGIGYTNKMTCNNYIISNYCWGNLIGIWGQHGNQNDTRYNRIYYNIEIGIYLDDCTNLGSIVGNEIKGSLAGIVCTNNALVSLKLNNITSNTIGIYYASTLFTAGQITNIKNNIYDNTVNFSNKSPSSFKIANNWWGSADASTINAGLSGTDVSNVTPYRIFGPFDISPGADTDTPLIISGLVANTSSDTNIALSWNKSGAGDFDHYNIYRSSNSGTSNLEHYEGVLGQVIAYTTNTNYVDVSPGNGTWYYHITASDDNSPYTNESWYSGEGSALISAFSSPANFTVIPDISAAGTNALLTWDDVGGETGYIICTNNTNVVITTLGSNITSWTHQTVVYGQTVKYFLRATNIISSTPWVSNTVTILPLPPDAVTNISLTNVGYNFITVQWDNEPTSAFYIIYTNRAGSSATNRALVTSNLSAKVSNLQADALYGFFVVGSNAGGISSNYIAPAQSYTALMPPVFDYHICILSKYNLLWHSVAGASGYKIYYATNYYSNYSGTNSSTTNIMNLTPLAYGITNYIAVRGTNTNSSPLANNVSENYFETNFIPISPMSDFTLTVTGTNEAVLSWPDVEAEQSYVILTNFQSGSAALDATLANVTKYTAKNDNFINRDITFYMYAGNVYGISTVVTNYASFYVLSPATFSAVPLFLPASTNALLIWSSVADASGYQVYTNTNAGIYQALGNVTVWTDPGVVQGQTITYYLRATNSVFKSAWISSGAVDILPVPPGTVTNLSVSNAAHDFIRIKWDGIPAATRYIVYTNGTNRALVTSVTMVKVPGLQVNTLYSFIIKASNAGGASSNYSAPAQSYTALERPVAVGFKCIDSKFNINWNPVNFAAGYQISIRSNMAGNYNLVTNIAATYISNFIMIDYGETNAFKCIGTNINFTDKMTYGDAGSSNFMSVALYVPISPITGLTSSVLTTNRTRLSWPDSLGEWTYVITTNAPDFANAVATVTQNVTVWTDKNENKGKTITYFVVGTNASGYSAWASNTAEILVPGTPDLDHTVLGASSVEFYWSPVTSATAEGYIIMTNALNAASVFTQVGYGVTNVINNNASGTCIYYLVATNYLGWSSYDSNIVTPGVPNPPVWESITALPSTVELKWSKIPGVTSYTLFRASVTNTNLKITISGFSPGVTNYSDASVVAGTTNYYWLRSYNGAGGSVFSAATNILSCPGIPAKFDLSFDSANSTVIVQWTNVTSATGFIIARGTTNDIITNLSGTVSVWTDANPPAGATVTYYLKSFNASGPSEWISKQISTKTSKPDLTKLIIGPSPFKPNDGMDNTGTQDGGITFANLSADAVIGIYTIHGQMVAELEEKDGDGKLVWIVPDKIASGVYLCRVTNTKGDEVIRKIIIIK